MSAPCVAIMSPAYGTALVCDFAAAVARCPLVSVQLVQWSDHGCSEIRPDIIPGHRS